MFSDNEIEIIKIKNINDDRISIIFNEIVAYYKLPYKDIFSIPFEKGTNSKQKEFKLSLIGALLKFSDIIPTDISEKLGLGKQRVFSYVRELNRLDARFIDHVIIHNRNESINNAISKQLIKYQLSNQIQTIKTNKEMNELEVERALMLISRKGKRNTEDKELIARFEVFAKENPNELNAIKKSIENSFTKHEVIKDTNNLNKNKMEANNEVKTEQVEQKETVNKTWTPFDGDVIQRDYATGETEGASVNPNNIPEPDFKSDVDTFELPPEDDSTSNDIEESTTTSTQVETKDETPSEIVTKDDSDNAADSIIEGYEMAHLVAKEMMQYSEKDIRKKQKQGKLNVEAEIETRRPLTDEEKTQCKNNGVQAPTSIVVKQSTYSVIGSYNEGLQQVLTVSDEFKEEVKPLLSKLLQEKGVGMSDTNRLIMIVGKDVVQKGIMVYSLLAEMKYNLETLKDTYEDMKAIQKENDKLRSQNEQYARDRETQQREAQQRAMQETTQTRETPRPEPIKIKKQTTAETKEAAKGTKVSKLKSKKVHFEDIEYKEAGE